MSEADYEFDAAISFAGTERPQAEVLARIARAAGFRVFYDRLYAADLWGKDLVEYFDRIYRERARYCVILVSEEYASRMWTIHERRSALARMVTERGRGYILPVEIERVDLAGLQPTIGRLSIKDYTIEEIGRLLVQKLSAAQPTHAPAQGETLTDTFAWQNKDHGKQSSAVYQYASPGAIPALGYIGCQDTGVGAGDSALGWRGIADADGGALAAAPASSGVALWGVLGNFGGWAAFRILRWLDKGEFAPSVVNATLSGSLLAGKSNYVIGLDGKCLAGVVGHDSDTTLTAAVTANAAPQAVTPASMTNIVVGSNIIIDTGASAETVNVTAVTATTFTAIFGKNHAPGAVVQPNRSLVARIDEAGAATQISQEFVAQGNVRTVAAHPTDPNILYCATTTQRVWMTNAGSAAGPGTVWTEVTTDKPAGISISSIGIAPAGQVYVLLYNPILSGGITTPLFEVSTGTWLPQVCAGQPAGGFGKLVADPVAASTLYASNGSKAFSLALAAGTWTWTDISDGLPGPPIYDLWIGTIGSGASTKVLLRAACPTRAIWERDVTAGAIDPPIALHLRDHFVDQGWRNPSPEGMMNPYNPVPSDRLWHYMCADIKIDAQQRHAIAGDPDFFQTDPEGTPIPPLSHVLFDELKDASQNLPQTDTALVHVQVRNRSATPAANVSVWAIYCRASGGVPSLSASPSMANAYPFWSQFTGAGIVPSLPADSPWTSVGPPQVLSGIAAANPMVASWNWTIPSLPSGDPGHYCMVAFVHGATSPIGETTRTSVDAITPTNKQVGQKNLHIGPPLPPGPELGGGNGAPQPGAMEEYVEFHNPTGVPRRADLRIDLRNLPPELGVSFHLANVDTERPLGESVIGVASTRDEPVPAKWRRGARRASLLARLIASLLRVEPTGDLEQGSQYVFDVQQLVEEGEGRRGAVAGGSRYIVVIAGDPKLRKPVVAPTHDPDTPDDEREELERQGDEFKYVPPWAEELVAAREKEQRKG